MSKSLAELGLAGADIAPKAEKPQPEALTLPPEIIARLDQETLKHGSSECCGFVIEVNGKMEVVPITNTREPSRSRLSYTMNFEEIAALYARLEKEKGGIRAVYHSHPSHQTAHFSRTDVARSFVEGTDVPLFNNISYIVIAAQNGVVRDRKAFTYNRASGTYQKSAVVSKSARA